VTAATPALGGGRPSFDRLDLVLAVLSATGMLLAAGLGIVHLVREGWADDLLRAAVTSVTGGAALGLVLAARLAARRTGRRRSAAVAAACTVAGSVLLPPLLFDRFDWPAETLVATIAAGLLGPAAALHTGLLLAAGAPPAGWPRRIAVAAEALAWTAAVGIVTLFAVEYRQAIGAPLPRGLWQNLPPTIGLALAGWAVSIVAVGSLATAARRRRLDASEAIAAARIALDCPDCAAVIEGPPGLLRCPQCRTQLLVEIEEPRCPCGYVLYRLAEPRCPECGRPVDHPERFAGG